MTILGLRCSNGDYSFAILSGSSKVPKLIASGSVPAPKGYTKPQLLKWFFQELQDLHTQHDLTAIVMKGTEGLAARGASFVGRVELEAMVFYAGAELGIKPVLKKVKSQVAQGL